MDMKIENLGEIMEKLIQCKNCLMDTSDSKIKFDSNGICDYCINYKKKLNTKSINNPIELNRIISKIKKYGKNKQHDCLIGLSGGADSSYLLHYAVKVLKLRPLVYAVDTGWNLNVAIENIEKLVKGLGVDLYTEVINWQEMKDLQRAFFLSNVPYQDLPQDHVIFAGIYNFAIKNKIKYVLTGANTTTEGVRPPIEWVYFNDLTLIKNIHRKFGKIPLNSLPLTGMIKYKIFYEYILGMKRIYLLDLIDYNKESAEKILNEMYNWQKYENKHYENIFTRFYEGYYLIKKFNFDKRKCYLSNLILSNQLSKKEASLALIKNPYDQNMINKDMIFIAKKLDFTLEEFINIINGPSKSYKDYSNSFFILKSFIILSQFFKIENREFR
jgi:N-acetyl sugar amidotransferase